MLYLVLSSIYIIIAVYSIYVDVVEVRIFDRLHEIYDVDDYRRLKSMFGSFTAVVLYAVVIFQLLVDNIFWIIFNRDALYYKYLSFKYKIHSIYHRWRLRRSLIRNNPDKSKEEIDELVELCMTAIHHIISSKINNDEK